MSLQASIIDLQQRCARGEDLTDDEMRLVLQSVRLSRTAVQESTTKRKAAITPMSDAQVLDLFNKEI